MQAASLLQTRRGDCTENSAQCRLLACCSCAGVTAKQCDAWYDSSAQHLCTQGLF